MRFCYTKLDDLLLLEFNNFFQKLKVWEKGKNDYFDEIGIITAPIHEFYRGANLIGKSSVIKLNINKPDFYLDSKVIPHLAQAFVASGDVLSKMDEIFDKINYTIPLRLKLVVMHGGFFSLMTLTLHLSLVVKHFFCKRRVLTRRNFVYRGQSNIVIKRKAFLTLLEVVKLYYFLTNSMIDAFPSFNSFCSLIKNYRLFVVIV